MDSNDDTTEGLTRSRLPGRHGPGSRRWGRVPRLAAASAAMVALSLGGAAVAGAATTGTSGRTAATSHPAGAPKDMRTPPTAAGKVASVGTDSFTITTRAGATVTVDVGSSTTYRDAKVTSATLADVTVGEQVAVVGSESSGTVTATSVMIGMPPGPHPGGPGKGKPGAGKPPAGAAGSGKPSGPPPSGAAAPTS